MKSFLPFLAASTMMSIAFRPDDGSGSGPTGDGDPGLVAFLDEEIAKIEANTHLVSSVKGAYDLLVSKFNALTGKMQEASATGSRTDIIDVTNKMTALLAATDTETLALKAVAGTQVDVNQVVPNATSDITSVQPTGIATNGVTEPTADATHSEDPTSSSD